jgi:hypothetical protein
MMTEPEIQELLSAHLDDELDADARAAVDAGLRRYPEVRRAAEELRRTVGLISALPRVSPPANFTEETAAAARRQVLLNRAGRKLVADRRRSVLWGRVASIAAVLALCCVAALAVWRAQSRLMSGEEKSEPQVAWDRRPAETDDRAAAADSVPALDSTESPRKAIDESSVTTFAATAEKSPASPSAPPAARELLRRSDRANAVDGLALEQQQRQADLAPGRFAGVVSVVGEPVRVLDVLDKALADADPAARASLRQARSTPGGAVSIAVSSDDPLVIDRVLNMLAESNSVRSLGFAPSAETIAADPARRREKLKELKDAADGEVVALAGAIGGGGAALEERKFQGKPVDGQAAGAPIAKAPPVFRQDPTGGRQIVSGKAEKTGKPAEGADRDDNSGAPPPAVAFGVTKPADPKAKSEIRNGAGRAGADGKHAEAEGGLKAATIKGAAAPGGAAKSAPAAEAATGHKADGPAPVPAEAAARKTESAREGKSVEPAVAQLGLLLDRLESRLQDAADKDKTRAEKDGNADARLRKSEDDRDAIRLAADQVRRQLLLLHLTSAEAAKSAVFAANNAGNQIGEGRADDGRGRERGYVAPGKPGAAGESPRFKSGTPNPGALAPRPVPARKVTLYVTIRPE